MPGDDDAQLARDRKRGAEGGGGDEPSFVGGVVAVAEDAQHGRPAVELAEPMAETGVVDDVAPALADESGADEGHGIVGWNADEDLLDELAYQQWRCLRHWLDPVGEGARIWSGPSGEDEDVGRGSEVLPRLTGACRWARGSRSDRAGLLFFFIKGFLFLIANRAGLNHDWKHIARCLWGQPARESTGVWR